MKKQIIPTTNPLGNGVTQWDDLAEIFGGIGSIVGNANSYSRTTDTTNRTVNETNGFFSFSNGTTLTVIILGGIAVIVTLILVLGKK